ncbi:type II toxin-antitoxin system VapC family toxin (plasmid) [Skermanella mucosa]|uniref:type II toxin-antitoxin system VapC family toxin n=1 Tax=Skermanella mucosa TaxID=1789672 RepID=UPI00389B083B|nr:type II toxin-antitoxin system VapC family toxin [Skermanella mucosa]
MIDRDVLSELEDPHGNRNAHAWMDSVPDNSLYLSVITVKEGQKGIIRGLSRASSEKARSKALKRQEWFSLLLSSFADRIVPIDHEISLRWGEMLAAREVHIMDTGIAATASIRGFIIATRNVDDYRGRNVQLVNPFSRRPQIVTSDVI